MPAGVCRIDSGAEHDGQSVDGWLESACATGRPPPRVMTMRLSAWSFVGLMTGLGWLALSEPAAAKRDGMNLPCHNCHEGQDKPELGVLASAARVEPGEAVTFTITAKHPRAKVGGVLIDSKGLGKFELIDAVGTRLFDGKVTEAVHAMPQPYANGQVQFSFRWIAPSEPSAVAFDIWSNAGNDNSMPADDGASEVMAAVSVGCDGAWYYVDDDGDGTGVERGKVFSCTPVPERILVGGDCDDDDPNISPKVAELCNSVDDDCDGKVDNGFTPGLLFTDADGDGYGIAIGTTMYGCPPLPGFAANFDDCSDSDAAVNPGATEVANGRDDNCDGQVDEVGSLPGAGGSASSGGSAGAPAGSSGSAGAPVAAPPAEPSGCTVAPTARSQAFTGLGAVVLLALASWRRGRRSAPRCGVRSSESC
jgi:Putative metal-binding motif